MGARQPAEQPARELAAKAGEASGGDGGGGASNGGSSEDDAAALETASVDAFLQTDAEFLRRATHIPDGSTAVCALLQKAGADGATDVLVANLGDSRAALVKRGGAARPISFDHKPNRPDEEARVRAAGGQVIFAGCWRVQGDLAVSRAFGDCHLKRFGVSARPELHRWRLERDDAYLVLASDGLWDVVDEVQCGKVLLRAKDPLEGARALGASRPTAARWTTSPCSSSRSTRSADPHPPTSAALHRGRLPLVCD